MTYHLPPLPWLRAFEAAARHCSFTAAAGELNLTQAAVSHQVRSLEQRLGFPLFDRLPRSLALTDMGRAYLPSVRKAFEELSASTAGLFGPPGGRMVTIRAPVSFAVLWLAPRLGSFRARYPEIDLRLCSAIWADSLHREDVDMDLRFGLGSWPGYTAQLLARESVVPVCGPAYAQTLRAGDEAAYLHAMTPIHIMGFEDLWQGLFRRLGDGSAPLPAPIKVDTSLAALEMAAAGLGCALVVRRFAAPLLAQGRLVQPIDREIGIEQAHYLLHRDGTAPATADALLFRDWLVEAMAEAGG